MISYLLSSYQRWAARRMFARWSPDYEYEVTENQYSAADQVAEEAIKLLGGLTKPLIVDIGIGTGLLAQQISDAIPCRLIGLDFTDDMLSIASARDITEILVKCDVGKDQWPIEDKTCDMVISAGLLEYLTPEMLQHFIHEAKRVLQHNGHLIFTYMPRSPQQKTLTLWRGQCGTNLICGYLPQEIEHLLQQNGFSILQHSTPFKGSVYDDGSSYDYRLITARS